MSHGYYQLPHGRVASINGHCNFPPLNNALSEPNGLIALDGDLSVARLLEAYQQGIFPWFSEGEPIMWWSPDPRMVLFLDEFKIATSLAKSIKKTSLQVRFNTDFRQVITACSQTIREGQSGTWITDEIIKAYCEMHEAGHAISAECWLGDKLVGGCYGVKIGTMFYGESMFHLVTNASKIAFVFLVQKLKAEGVEMMDCQMKTAHLANFGAREISRKEFAERLVSNL